MDTDGEAVLLVLEVGDGFGGIGGCVGGVGCVLVGVDDAVGLLELLDVGEPDDVELGGEVGVEDDGDEVELDGEDELTDVVVVQGGTARWPGKRGAVLVAGNRAPGSTRRGSAVADDSSVLGSTGSAVLETAPAVVDETDVAGETEVAASVLVGPAAPEPKSALRCTKPICAATRERPETPPTAAATPEIDRAATVTAATTPTRAGVRLERA